MNEFEQAWMRMGDFCNENPISYVILVAFYVLLWLRQRKKKLALQQQDLEPAGQSYEPAQSHKPAHKPQRGLLDQVLFNWSLRDPFTVTDLLRSVAIFGASGSGKTSGSGYVIGKALARCPQIGGLICASKPEDRIFWQNIFKKAGRPHDLAVFDASANYRFNFINYILECGGDTRDITQALMVIGETLDQGNQGRNYDQFWHKQNEVMLYNAIEPVRLALGKVTAPDIQRFINSAPLKPEDLSQPEFKNTFHYQVMDQAYKNLSSSIEKHDYQLCAEYWTKEYPNMADKMRSGILAGVMGTLHVFNTGMVRQLVSSDTNISPVIMDSGMWVLVDLPISSCGAAGAFILSGWKYLTQRYVLARHARENTPVTVIWCDEAQKVVNSFDAAYLAECRSHRGCMVYLTQSIHAYYVKMKEAGEHEADSFLTNLHSKVFHAVGDSKTASYAGSLIGRRLVTRFNTSSSAGDGDPYESVFGRQKVSVSSSSSIENICENTEFMQNLRTGGKANGYIVDGIVVRSAAPFSTGEAYLKVSFDQRG